MTSLFLLTANWDEDPELAQRVRKESEEGDAIVLSLDFWAGEKLRRASIPFELPRRYFDPAVGDELDALAARLARTWHEGLEGRLQHDGIPLGEMAEYAFTFLFIDALRSVEIARGLFDARTPDEVFLSRQPSLRPPNAICHEPLPGVVALLASQQDVPATWFGPPFTLRPPFRDAISHPAMSARTFLHAIRGRKSVLFVNVAGHTHIASALSQRGLTSLTVLPTRRARGKAKRLGRALQSLWKERREGVAADPDFVYRDIPLVEVLGRRFERFFREDVPQLIAGIEGANWLIRRLKPRILVTGVDSSPDMRTLSRVFVRRGLPVLVVQHGAVSVDIGGFYVPPLEGSRQAVWGTIPREWHLRRGKSPESQVVTGNPALDAIAGGWDPSPGEVHRGLGLDPGQSILLLVTEWFSGSSSVATVEDEERFLRSTLQALNRFPDHRTVVKLHPGYQIEYESLVRAIAAGEGVDVTMAKKDLWDLLSVADVVIISSSTVGLEAMMLGKPVVVVQAFEGREEVPYVASGAALGASPEANDIAAAVEKTLHDYDVRAELRQAREDFVRGYASEQDGRASERVARLIEEMIHEPPPYGESSGREAP